MAIQLDPSEPVFTIGVATRLTGLSQKQLRSLEAKEIVVAARTEQGRRLYRLNDLDRLRFIAYLIGRRKVNTAGLIVALEMLDRIPEQDRNQYLEEVLVEEPSVCESEDIDLASLTSTDTDESEAEAAEE